MDINLFLLSLIINSAYLNMKLLSKWFYLEHKTYNLKQKAPKALFIIRGRGNHNRRRSHILLCRFLLCVHNKDSLFRNLLPLIHRNW